MLDKLKEMTGGDEQRMQLYLETYHEGVEEFINGLSAAYDLQDHGIARDIAHGAKPLFTVMGFDHLWQLANQIEVTDPSETDVINKGIKDLVREMRRSLDALKSR